MATGISVTSKAHIIFHHLGEYLTITGRGLALDSEQSLESSHFLFAQTHSKYYIRDKHSSKFVPKLIHALCDYNGSHIWTCKQLNKKCNKFLLICISKVVFNCFNFMYTWQWERDFLIIAVLTILNKIYVAKLLHKMSTLFFC